MINVFLLAFCLSVAGAMSTLFAFFLLWFVNDLIRVANR